MKKSIKLLNTQRGSAYQAKNKSKADTEKEYQELRKKIKSIQGQLDVEIVCFFGFSIFWAFFDLFFLCFSCLLILIVLYSFVTFFCSCLVFLDETIKKR